MGIRLALISDIHGNIEALKSVLEDIASRNIDDKNIYCVGDLVGYGPRPNEVIKMIKENNIQTILGNYDEAVGFYLPTCGCNIDSPDAKIKSKNSLGWSILNTSEENKEFLRSIEEQISIEIVGYNILFTHGSPFSINDYVFEYDVEKQEEIADGLDEDIIIFGHTHKPYCKEVNGKFFINTGSVGRPKDGDNRACYCILELGEKINVEFVRVQYDVEKVAKEIENSDLLNIFAEILRKGEDIKLINGGLL